MSLNLTGLADVAERSLQQITEIADDRRQTLDGAKHHAHVDVRLNELEESALSSLLMPMCARPQPRSPRPVARAVAPRTISPRASQRTSASACHTRSSRLTSLALAAGCLRICWGRRSAAHGRRATRSRWRRPTGRPRPRASRRATSSCASRPPARATCSSRRLATGHGSSMPYPYPYPYRYP